MFRTVDLYLYTPRSVTKFRKPQRALEIEVTNHLDERSKVPIVWVFVFIAFFVVSVSAIIAWSILYVTDIKMKGEINAVRMSNLESTQANGMSELKSSITELKTDLRELVRGVNATAKKSGRNE